MKLGTSVCTRYSVTIYAPCSQIIEYNKMVHLMHSAVCSADVMLVLMYAYILFTLSSEVKVSHILGSRRKSLAATTKLA